MAFEIAARISPRTAKDFDEMIAPIADKHEGSGRNLKWTLMALADYANAEGFAWPSIKSIELWTGLSTRSVQRALKQAQVLGLVRIRKRTDASSQYLFNLSALPYVERPTMSKQRGPHEEYEDWEEPDLFEGAAGTPATVAPPPCQGDTPPVPQTTSTHATVTPYPIIEPSEEPVSEPSGSTDVVPATATGTDLWGKMQERTAPLESFIKAEWDKLKAKYPNMGECRSITASMSKLVRDRAKEHIQTGETLHDVWILVFKRIEESEFLTGRVPPRPPYNKRYRLTLSKLLKPHIFREVINDGYGGETDNSNIDPETGELLGPAATATRGTRERFRSARQRGG